MRFVIDANLSPVVAEELRAGGHDAVHVADIGLLTASDEVILAAAAEDDRVIVSADADFAALLALGHLAKPSFVLLRSADHLSSSQQADLLLANLSAVSDDLEEGLAGFAALPRVFPGIPEVIVDDEVDDLHDDVVGDEEAVEDERPREERRLGREDQTDRGSDHLGQLALEVRAENEFRRLDTMSAEPGEEGSRGRGAALHGRGRQGDVR